MERDEDLIRDLLLRVEEGPPHDFHFADRSEHEVNYHLALLVEANYLRGEVVRTGTPDRGKTNVYSVHVQHLTMEGHDFLDAIRDEGVWAKTKERAQQVAESVPLSVLKEVAIEIVKNGVGLSG